MRAATKLCAGEEDLAIGSQRPGAKLLDFRESLSMVFSLVPVYSQQQALELDVVQSLSVGKHYCVSETLDLRVLIGERSSATCMK
eukprot:286012-Hanusia_phi.AAC.2